MNSHQQFQQAMTSGDFDRMMESMKAEVARHKWFMSERAGHDVGEQVAVNDWSRYHQNKWMEEQRR